MGQEEVKKRRLDMIKKSQDIAKAQIIESEYFLCPECLKLILEKNINILYPDVRGRGICPAHGGFQAHDLLKIECKECAISNGRCQICEKKFGKVIMVMD